MSTSPILFVSTTDISHFRRCRKLFDYSYVRNLTPAGEGSQALRDGRDFHLHVAAAAREIYGGKPFDELPEAMAEVAQEYLFHHPLPRRILVAEEPFYTQVGFAGGFRVILRTTLDLVYVRGNTLVGRDYKTFAAAPSLDVDLDFQGALYACVLQRRYPGFSLHEFEWEYVRRELGRELGRGAAREYVPWSVDDRYQRISRVLSDAEYETTWNELLQTVEDLVRAMREERFYRTPLRSGPHGCEQCHFKSLCKAEYSTGGHITGEALELLATPAPQRYDDAVLYERELTAHA